MHHIRFAGAPRRLPIALGLFAATLISACGGGQGGSAPEPTAVDAATADASRQALATGPTWTMVAWENQWFNVGSGTRTVRFGANGAWTTRSVSGSAPCTTAFFGTDPAVGVGKQCEVDTSTTATTITTAAPATATSWTVVAWENQSFSVSGT